MNLNADFSKRASVHGQRTEWVKSPMPGVDRRMLDRIGDEVARATSIVRYAAGSKFSSHVHTGGEEFMVLDGIFQDEHGDFPAGSYIRNPPQSSHTPGSEAGCVIMVKLWQFDLADRTHVRIDTNKMRSLPAADRPGVAVVPLFHDEREDVRIETWQPNAAIQLDVPYGLEIFVLDGDFVDSGEKFEVQSWLRLPCDASLSAMAGKNGCKVWIKADHLKEIPKAPTA
ncbi:MAG: cupin domain-containing protein [Anderseniella sp.]